MAEPVATSPAPPVPQNEMLSWLRRAVDEHAIVAITDAQGVIVHANDRFCAISGYGREELLGQTHRVVRSGYHPAEFFSDMWRTINAGRVWRGILCNRAKGGRLYWLESTIVPLLDPQGRPRFHLALRTDITGLMEAKQAAAGDRAELAAQVKELHSAQNQLQMFFTHAPVGISWREFLPDGRPGANHVNQRFCEIIGLTAQEALDMENIRRASDPEDWVRQEQLTAEIYNGRRDGFTLEKRYLHRDGGVVWTNLTVAVRRDEDGRVTHHFAMLEDINERRRMEQEVRDSEQRLRTYINSASEILYALTPEGAFTFVSPAWTTKLGHPVNEVVGRSFADFVHPDDVARCAAFIHETLARGHSAGAVEYRVRHADGRWMWHASTGSAYTDKLNRRHYLGVGRDVTVRREAQEQLRAALARREELERIVNRSPSVVVLWRAAEGWPVEFVSHSVRQFGYEPEYFTVQGHGFGTITHPDDLARVTVEVQAHAAAGHDEYNQEYRVLCADGTVRWVDDHTVVRRDEHGVVTHHEGLITDVTARREALELDRAAHERDLRIAGEVQQHLHPRVFPDISEVEIAAISNPSMLIGGDYYDVLPVDERRWGFVIADVAGKGAAAALMMAECRATLRLIAAGELSPAAVLRRVNRVLHPDMRPGTFIVLFYGILDLDTNVLRFCRAGHEPPLLLRREGGAPELLPGEGLALGLDEGPLFDEVLEEREVALQPGDLVALYTDGVTEACNPQGEEFNRERLVHALERHREGPLHEVLRKVDRYVRNFCVLAPRTDDRTLMLIRPR